MWLNKTKQTTFCNLITLILTLFCVVTDSRQCKLARFHPFQISGQGRSSEFHHDQTLDHHVILAEVIPEEKLSLTSRAGESCRLIYDSSLFSDSNSLYLLQEYPRLYLASTRYPNPATLDKLFTVLRRAKLRCGSYYHCMIINEIKENAVSNHVAVKRNILALSEDNEYPYGLYNNHWIIIATSIMVIIVTVVIGFLCTCKTSEPHEPHILETNEDIEKITLNDPNPNHVDKQPKINKESAKPTTTDEPITQESKPSLNVPNETELTSKSNVLELDNTVTVATVNLSSTTDNQKEPSNSMKSSESKEIILPEEDCSPTSCNSEQETAISGSLVATKIDSIESPYANITSTNFKKDFTEETSSNTNSNDDETSGKLNSESEAKKLIKNPATGVYEELQFKDIAISIDANVNAKHKRSTVAGEQYASTNSIANRKLPDIPRIKNPDAVYAQIIKARPISIDLSTTGVSRLIAESDIYRSKSVRSKPLNPRSASSPHPPRIRWTEDDIALKQNSFRKLLNDHTAPDTPVSQSLPDASTTEKEISYSLKEVDSSGYAIIRKKVSTLITIPANVSNDDLESKDSEESVETDKKDEEPYEDVDKLRWNKREAEVCHNESDGNIKSD